MIFSVRLLKKLNDQSRSLCHFNGLVVVTKEDEFSCLEFKAPESWKNCCYKLASVYQNNNEEAKV